VGVLYVEVVSHMNIVYCMFQGTKNKCMSLWYDTFLPAVPKTLKDWKQ
jgi:hypothetical protein